MFSFKAPVAINARMATARSGQAHLQLRLSGQVGHTITPHGSGSRQAAAWQLPDRYRKTLAIP
ncbi:MAG TPA: hypothetical protein VE641_20605 [Chthoniobacterales bacterium]|nr:hypothetical protein [Chthoniobacterales bacterium]